jgi:hypothetical protein
MSTQLVLDSHQYFLDAVEEAFLERRIESSPYVKTYVVDILKHYLFVENLYDQEDNSGKKTRKTMAELYLSANQLSRKDRAERLKKLGDSSLYISGFFSDSFQRKIIDVDYYVDMGKMAFSSLANDVDEDTFSKLFNELSHQFLDLVDVLSLISQKANITDEENILRIMDVYSKTGSNLRGETLAEKGYFNSSTHKKTKQ